MYLLLPSMIILGFKFCQDSLFYSSVIHSFNHAMCLRIFLNVIALSIWDTVVRETQKSFGKFLILASKILDVY